MSWAHQHTRAGEPTGSSKQGQSVDHGGPGSYSVREYEFRRGACGLSYHQGGFCMSLSHQTRLGGRTWYRRAVLGIVAVVMLAGWLFGPTGSRVAHASSFVSLPANGSNVGPVSFQGGWIQTNPIVYLDFWGSKWNTDVNH